MPEENVPKVSKPAAKGAAKGAKETPYVRKEQTKFNLSIAKVDMVELRKNHEALFAKLEGELEVLKSEVVKRELIADKLQAKLQELTKFQLISFVAVPKFKRLNFLRMSKPMRPVVFGIRGSLYYNAKKSGDENQLAIAAS